MADITIELNQEQLAALTALAKGAGTSLEAYVQALITHRVEEKQQHDMEKAMNHVLSKNHELYERLS
jgi:hypothetical protein